MDQPDDGLQRLLTPLELAGRLGVSRFCIYDAMHNRGLPFVRFGRNIRLDPLHVRRWLDAGGDLTRRNGKEA